MRFRERITSWVDSIGGAAEQFCEQRVLGDGVTGWQTLILA
jgi:hypothetical protein